RHKGLAPSRLWSGINQSTLLRGANMKISRRAFPSAVLSLTQAARAQQDTLKAAVTINTQRVVGDIDPKIYGNFIEHLGRCIEGGIFDEKNSLSDSDGYRRDVEEAVRKLNVGLLRWPGGNFSSNYQW